jgi:hypothetical protein
MRSEVEFAVNLEVRGLAKFSNPTGRAADTRRSPRLRDHSGHGLSTFPSGPGVTLASICGPTCGVPLFLHVLGATLLIGGISAVVVVAVAALRYPEHAALLRRIAFRVTLIVVWPAFIATVAGGHWTLSREHLADNRTPPGWALVGIAVTDVGVLVVIVLTVFAWLALRRPRMGRAVAALATLYLGALLVTLWAMTAKPGS